MMGEFETSGFRLREVTPEDTKRSEQLYRLVESTVLEGLATDNLEAALLRALMMELFRKVPPGHDGGRFLDPIEQVYSAKRASEAYYPVGYDLRTLEIAIDKQARRWLKGDNYPRTARKPDFWSNRIFPNIDLDELEWDMQQNLRSTITEGYAVLKLLSQTFADRWPHPPTVVDIGTSLGLGPKKWKMHEQYPFAPEEALRAPMKGEAVSPHLGGDPEAQAVVNDLVNRDPIIGDIYGFDILPVQPYETDLVFSSTFPLAQSAANPRSVEEFMALNAASPKGVHLPKMHVDATSAASLSQISEALPTGKADIFIFSGVILQVPPPKLAEFFNNFLPYCNAGALFFINEWADSKPSAPGGLATMRRDYWHRGHFKTFIKDPFSPQDGAIEFCRHLSRQCKQMYLSKAGRRLLLER